MQSSPEIFSLRTLTDTVLIGPRAAFGRGHRHAVQSDEAVRTRLNAARIDPGAILQLRRAFERWRAGESFSYLSDRALIDRVAADTRRGRLAVFLVPNVEMRAYHRPESSPATIKLKGFQPRGTSAQIAKAQRIVSTTAGLAHTSGSGRDDTLRVAGAGSSATSLVPSGSAVLPPLNVGVMTIEQRFAEILHRTTDSKRLGDEAIARLKAMSDPEQIGATVAMLTIWAAAHPFGIGFAFDGVLLGVGAFLLGRTVVDAVRTLGKFLEVTIQARSEAELDVAADLLATVIDALGIRVFRLALLRGATRLKTGTVKREMGSFGRREELPKPAVKLRAPPELPKPPAPPSLPMKPPPSASCLVSAAKAAAAFVKAA